MQPGGSQPQTPQLPELVNNPVASLRPFDVEVRIGDNWIVVPGRPAVDWLELIMGDLEEFDLDAIFPGLAEDPDELVNESLWNGEVTVDDLYRKALELISAVAGRPWYVALRMIRLAESRWSILGSAVARNVDVTKVSLSAWLDELWLQLFEHTGQDKWTMLASQIEIEPPPLTPDEETQKDPFAGMEMSRDQFTQLMRG